MWGQEQWNHNCVCIRTIHISARSRHSHRSFRYTGMSSMEKQGSSLNLSISPTLTAAASRLPPLPSFPHPPLFHSKAVLSTKLSISLTFGLSFALPLHHWCRLKSPWIPQSDASGVESKQTGAWHQETNQTSLSYLVSRIILECPVIDFGSDSSRYVEHHEFELSLLPLWACRWHLS